MKKFQLSALFSVLVLSGSVSYATPCDIYNKDAIHCVYATGLDNQAGKYIKVKEVTNGVAKSVTYCVNSNTQSIYTLYQHLGGVEYKAGDKVALQFSQCFDEDCTTTKSLLADTFTIAKKHHHYSATTAQAAIQIDPTYGTNCELPNSATHDKNLKNRMPALHTNMRLADAARMIDMIPLALEGTAVTLQRMRELAIFAANGASSCTDKQNLDAEYQTLKDEITRIQTYVSLNGPKYVSDGSLTLIIGHADLGSNSLMVSMPATSIAALHLQDSVIYNSACTTDDAMYAVDTLNDAITTVEFALAQSVAK